MTTTLNGIIVYSLYYMLCVCGPMDIAKIEMLKTNTKYVGMLYCVLSGFSCVVQALFLDEIIDKYLDDQVLSPNSPNFYIISSVSLACTVMAFLSIFGLIKKEILELRTFHMMKSTMQKSHTTHD